MGLSLDLAHGNFGLSRGFVPANPVRHKPPTRRDISRINAESNAAVGPARAVLPKNDGYQNARGLRENAFRDVYARRA